jgi:hypothetical protein
MGSLGMRVRRSSITLEAGVTEYDPPADIKRVTRCGWARAENKARKPWNPNWIHNLPDLSLVETDSGKKLELSREISAAELADIGSTCTYYYEAAHVIDADASNTSIQAEDRDLLLLRAKVEACRELAMRQIGKPIALRDGYTNTPRNGSPAALAESLYDGWKEQMRLRH